MQIIILIIRQVQINIICCFVLVNEFNHKTNEVEEEEEYRRGWTRERV